MNGRYLEVTFRKGKLFAAYFHLPTTPGEKNVGAKKAGAGILIDYGKSGRPIGVEITDPDKINLRVINEILSKLNLQPAEREELTPLLAAKIMSCNFDSKIHLSPSALRVLVAIINSNRRTAFIQISSR